MRETARFLPPVPASIAAARRFVAATCAAWGVPATDSVLLMTAELVRNAVEHGGSGVELVVTHDMSVLRVEVVDRQSRLPREPGEARLELVGALSTSWGVHPEPGGTVAWFESVA